MLLAGKPGSRRNATLLRVMTPEQVYHASTQTLSLHLSGKDAECYADKDLSAAIRIEETCREKGIRIVCYHDPEYPTRLREIEDAPSVLFCLGMLPHPNKPTVGIVGTRNCTQNAAGQAATYACSLAASGFQIVSGMANGVDTYVHKGTLVKGFPSIAVLGCGVDVIYPKQNKVLYTILCEQGGLISEYPPGTPPLPGHFPRRNRIISGLSDGVLVVECPPKSGSMSTARHAVEQNRTLFALPSTPGDRTNTGTNDLIKHGAVFCADPMDVINEFLPLYGDRLKPEIHVLVTTQTFETSPSTASARKPEPKHTRKPHTPSPETEASPPEPTPLRKDLSPEEEKICLALNDGPLSADGIVQKTDIPFYRILPLLQALELIGCIETLPGSLFRRK